MAVLSQFEFIGVGGWEGGGVVGWWGGWWMQIVSRRRAKANIQKQMTVHSDINDSTVPSVGDPDWHNSQGRPGLPLESVWHSIQSY